MMSLPVWLPNPMFLLGASLCLVPCSLLGGLCPGGVSVQEGSLSRGRSLSGGSLSRSLCRETPQNQKSGWYASYWNALLLTINVYSWSKTTNADTETDGFGINKICLFK